MRKREPGAELQRKAGKTGPVSQHLSRLSRTNLLIVVRFIQESRSPDASTTMRQLWGQARNASQQARLRMCTSRGAQLFTWAVVKLYCCRSLFACSEHQDHDSQLKIEEGDRGNETKELILGLSLYYFLTASSVVHLPSLLPRYNYFQAPEQQSKNPAVER